MKVLLERASVVCFSVRIVSTELVDGQMGKKNQETVNYCLLYM